MLNLKKYYAFFGALPNIKTEHWQKIISYFKNPKNAYKGKVGDFLEAGFSEKWIDNFLDFKRKNNLEKIWEDIEKRGIKIITIEDEAYPENLKEIYNPPFIIYAKGKIESLNEDSIAIVGSRKGTDYGKRATFEIAKELSQSGITIISGLALGLDTEAHKGALEGGGRTVAVLANGLDTIYPATNKGLANKIIENGCIISEQPLGMPPLKQNFPARNRIISGLSLGVFITESGEHSGTLHTASFALEQNRQIYALPGPIYNPLSVGPNNLIKNGAKPVSKVEDILEDFGIKKKNIDIKPVGEDEEMIFEILKNESLHIDEIIKISNREPEEISRIISMMEIKGKVKHLGGMVYTISQ